MPLIPPPYPPGGTPARPAPVAPARRFVKRGFYVCCCDCGMAVEFCACDRRLAPEQNQAEAAAGASLARRVADCQGGR